MSSQSAGRAWTNGSNSFSPWGTRRCIVVSPLFALHSYAIHGKNVPIEETVMSRVGAYGAGPPLPADLHHRLGQAWEQGGVDAAPGLVRGRTPRGAPDGGGGRDA